MTKFYENKCTFDEVFDTTKIQINSVITFAGALGYEPVYNRHGKLVNFLGERYKSDGMMRVSPNTMVKMHNEIGEFAYEEITDPGVNRHKTLDSFLKDGGDIHIIAMFAHYARTIKKAKLTHIKGVGYVVQSHKIEFCTKLDAKKAGF